MKTKLLTVLFLGISSVIFSQISVDQFFKIKDTPITDLTVFLKDYGFKLNKIEQGQMQYVNDKNIIKEICFLSISGGSVTSKKAKLIQFGVMDRDFLKFLKMQLLISGFKFLHNTEVAGLAADVYTNEKKEMFLLHYDDENKVSHVKYFTNND